MDDTAIRAHIPIDRLLALGGLRHLPERTEGAALFADISGFTPCSEPLAVRAGFSTLGHSMPIG
jgi:hypothetical protein